MSKIEAGKLELLPAEYELASLINDSVQLNIMRIGSKPVEFELHVDENTPAAMVGDVLRIKQILNNVLSNAFKYTDKGLVTLSISHERVREDGLSQYEPSVQESWKEQDDVSLVFLVRDTGHGMTPEQTRRMFDEYSRFHQSGDRVIEGTGLGMNITLQLVRMMNGEIFVESEPGRGSTFTVRLPQRDVGAGVLGRELADQLRQFRLNDLKQMRRAQIIREPMPYGSVLVVDDVATNLYVAKGLLVSYGLKVDLAESGFEAIGKIEQGRIYDIVFMDHMMPEMDGMKATQILRGRGYTQPVVALTANALVGQAEIYLENGFDDFISKPIDLRQMNAILNKFVRDRHPPEVVEAARRQAHGAQEHRADATPQTALEPNLAKIFLRDASKALAVLEKLGENQDAYSDEDMRTFTLTLHGLKSALANIDEADLADRARILEEAGRARDSALMASESPAFLRALREVAERITPAEDDGHSAATDEDRAFLRDKLLALKAACMTYDKKAAKEALTATGQRAWPLRTREMLDAIAEHMLHSKFKSIVSIVDDAMRTL
jgi:CheY-like chemotaxis protein/two-component sensor histidine kinase/HPt (histidine-containing phosphotransfer) domain-containing protein